MNIMFGLRDGRIVSLDIQGKIDNREYIAQLLANFSAGFKNNSLIEATTKEGEKLTVNYDQVVGLAIQFDGFETDESGVSE